MCLSVTVRRFPPRPVIDIAGDIDLVSAPWLRECLLSFLPCGGHRLLVNLSGVRFVDCSGLRTLLAAEGAEVEGCSVRFIAPSRPVRRLAELTGLWELVPHRSGDRNWSGQGDGW